MKDSLFARVVIFVLLFLCVSYIVLFTPVVADPRPSFHHKKWSVVEWLVMKYWFKEF